jgi:hypothetical protein
MLSFPTQRIKQILKMGRLQKQAIGRNQFDHGETSQSQSYSKPRVVSARTFDSVNRLRQERREELAEDVWHVCQRELFQSRRTGGPRESPRRDTARVSDTASAISIPEAFLLIT